MKKARNNMPVIQETINGPRIDDLEICTIIEEKLWMTPIKAYLEENVLLKEHDEAKKL